MGRDQRLFLGNLSSDCRERDIEKFFDSYGKINEIVIKQGYGFIEFDHHRDAEDAKHDQDGRDLNGQRMRIEFAKPRGSERRDDRGGGGGGYGGGRDSGRRGGPPGRKTGYRVVVENLSSRTSWQDLKDYFRKFGDIQYANAHKPRQGEGVIEFNDKRDMQDALDDQDNLELDGKRLEVREEDGGGGGGGRGRSRSRSRSRSRDRRDRSRSGDRGGRRKDDSRSRSRSRD